MASKEIYYNQDVHVTQVHRRDEQDRLVSCESEHVIPTNLTDAQEEHSSFSSRLSVCSPEQECTSTTMILSATPASDSEQTTLMPSAEEFYLQKELRKQRLQHRRQEELLEHLLKVKELTHKLSETLKEPSSIVRAGMLPDVQLPLNAVNPSANDTSANDFNSESKTPMINPYCSLEVELLKKLHLQRIQQQIEIEGAMHKLEMNQLSTLK